MQLVRILREKAGMPRSPERALPHGVLHWLLQLPSLTTFALSPFR